MEQALALLLTWTQFGVNDFDISIGGEPGEADHTPREIDDLDGLAHIEHEDAAALFGRAER